MSRHFDKVLVANRGEIACRVLRTCRRLGIRTVAVYSEADARARHVALADEAVCIGPSPAPQSYLSIDALVDACRRTGAQAVHPGCGFLSENPLFAETLHSNHLTFVGPPARVLRLMGDKLSAKTLAHEAGLPCIPSTSTPVQSGAEVHTFAQRVGYPVLLKACAGGGGKGIRLVKCANDCDTAFDLCQSEAQRFFADSSLMVEKALDAARHVEVQVLADHHGHVVCFPERECSVQRRNQKVIEESPSPLFEACPDLRERAMDLSRTLTRTAGYVSVGTVEFLVTPHDGQLYFLEVNPRLQVEHTVTEMVTGTDLVEQMLRVAAGMPISVDQARVRCARGHATEVRVQAEDPLRDYAPSIGRVTEYAEPQWCSSDALTVRCDSGVCAGSTVSLYYDSLLSKVCAWGNDRSASIQHLKAALDAFVLRGVQLNVGLAYSVLESAEYTRGHLSTRLLDTLLATVPPLTVSTQNLVSCIAACLRYSHESDLYSSGSGNALSSVVEYVIAVCAQSASHDLAEQLTGTPHQIRVRRHNDGLRFVCESADGAEHVIGLNAHSDGPLVEATISAHTWAPPPSSHAADGVGTTTESVLFQYFGALNGFVHDIVFKGRALHVTVCSPLQYALLREPHQLRSAPKTEDAVACSAVVCVRAAMPSILVDITAQAGDYVRRGQAVATVEAMKMRSKLCAPIDGKIQRVCAQLGATMKSGDTIVEIVPT